MPNKIQIKRTTVTGRTPNTTSSGNSQFIDTGELALNLTDGKMFSSNGIAYFEVGANLNSIAVGGTFTANATLVNAAALNVVNRTNTATLYVTTSANVGTAAVINSTSFTHTGRINANSGIKIGNGYTQYETIVAFGSDVAGTWRKIAEVSLVSGQYSTSAFKVDIIDPNVNHGDQSNSWKPDILTYYVSCVRQNDVVTDTPDQCYVRGPANHIRAVKTSTGNYEIQIANEATNRDYFVKIQCYVENINDNGGITFFSGLTAGSAGTAQYDAVVGSSINFFESINIGNSSVRIFSNSTTINVGTTVSVNTSLANFQALNVVNQTNTGTLFVTTSANVGTNVQITPNSLRLGNSTSNIVITNTSITHLSNVGFTPQLIVRNSTSDAFGPYWNTGKSRSGGAVQTGDDIGTFMFQGHDGTDFRNSAYIVSEIEGTVSTNIVPSRMDFFTTNTSGNLLNRLTIHANGNINVNNGILTMGGGVGTTNGVAITNTSITVGNTVTNSFMTPSTLQIGSSITANSISANLLVNTAISAIIANGSIGTSGQVLTSNATGIYWSTVSGGGGSGISLAEARKAVSLRL